MYIIVTDSGAIWNHENPYLELFKKAVIVVCLSGKKVTDKYECFISPYQSIGMGIDTYGTESSQYLALESVKQKLIYRLDQDDVLFLTDGNPKSLYPYMAIKDKYQGRMHLCCLTPWRFQTKHEHAAYDLLISDLSQLDSFLYYDSNMILNQMPPESTFPDLLEASQKLYGDLLLKSLRGMLKTSNAKMYFDFATETYIPLKNGFTMIDLKNQNKPSEELELKVEPRYGMLRMIQYSPSYPSTDKFIKEDVEQLIPRVDGKKVCNILKEQRRVLAAANHIPFQTVECPSIGPCAGTCEKCDKELAYLSDAMKQIPEELRVYPTFDPEWEMLE